MNTKQRGDETEAKVLTEFVSRQFSVSIPFGDNDPYDLVVDVDGELLRIQCKTGWIEDECIRFKTASKTTKEGQISHNDYTDKIEAFAVFCRGTDSVYWIPIEEVGKRSTYLRITDAKIDHPSINFAEEYTLDSRLPMRNEETNESA